MKIIPRRLDWLLLLVLSISVFFRFYKFEDLQYWSGDEELVAATIRHIIWDKSPTLLVQNANLEFGLGPFYHYVLTPFYFAANFNLVVLQSVASILGVITTFLVYKIGLELLGRRYGLISSFIYASSFFIALYDRRLWHLTLNSFLMAIAIFLLVRLIKGKKKWGFLLAIPIGFAFHSDASLIVIVISIFFLWIIKRFSFGSKNRFLGLLILGIFAAPLLLADVRYNGSFRKAVIQSLARPLKGENITSHNFRLFEFTDFTQTLSKVVIVSPSNFIEQEFCYCKNPKAPLGIAGLILVLLTLLFTIVLIKKKRSYNIVWSLILSSTVSLFIGIFIFNSLFRGNFHQHYFVIMFPVFAILIGVFINEIPRKNNFFLGIILSAFFLTNLYSLINSNVKYPLAKKIRLVERSLETISSEQFSLKASEDPYIQGGGWTELYTLIGHPAVRSYWYDYWEWIYSAYSLYPIAIKNEDPGKIVLIQKAGENLDLEGKVLLSSYSYKDIELLVIDNSSPE